MWPVNSDKMETFMARGRGHYQQKVCAGRGRVEGKEGFFGAERKLASEIEMRNGET